MNQYLTKKILGIGCLVILLVVLVFGLNISDLRTRLTAMTVSLTYDTWACMTPAGDVAYSIEGKGLIYIDRNNRQITCIDKTNGYNIKVIDNVDDSRKTINLDESYKQDVYDTMMGALGRSPFSCSGTTSPIVDSLIAYCNQ